MRKIALHWQILIALVFAILYGLYFKTTYSINQDGLESLKKSGASELTINGLQGLKDDVFKTKKSFIKAVKASIGDEEYDKNKKSIVDFAYQNKAIDYVSWMGTLFMRLLKMLIVPLVIGSIISGVTNIGGGENLGRIGAKTITYYIMTSFFAILTGLIFVNIFRPGVGLGASKDILLDNVEGFSASSTSFSQTLMEIVPTNIFQAFVNGDMLAIIFFSLLFGFFITKIGNKPMNLMKDFFNALFDTMMNMTMWVIKFTPIGIFGIVAKVIADQDDFVALASSLGWYMVTVLVGLLLHSAITLPFIVRFIGKANPFKHLKAVSTPLLTAFSTSSSGATLPLTMNAVENNSGVSNKISSFTLPLGATINMDGTALYECVAAIFIAQAYGIELSITQQVIVVITALLASVGAAAIPMAGLVMITIVLTAVGLPLEGIGLILAVDRILDMFRTTVNVWSDTCGAVVVAKSEGETLKV